MRWRDIDEHDYFLHARSFHTAAKKLVRLLDVDPGFLPELDFCPALTLYRHAVELHLKVIVLGEGGRFLATPPDELSVQKTRSLSWLAQFVCQIVTTLRWEDAFRTTGIENLAGFKAVIEEANGIDPTYRSFVCPAEPPGGTAGVGPIGLRSHVLAFLERMDALIELLEVTADGLAAEWALRANPEFADDWPEDDSGFHPTIQ
jgi:hypothetical protein